MGIVSDVLTLNQGIDKSNIFFKSMAISSEILNIFDKSFAFIPSKSKQETGRSAEYYFYGFEKQLYWNQYLLQNNP